MLTGAGGLTLLRVTGVALFTDRRQGPLAAKRLRLALLRFSLYCHCLDRNRRVLEAGLSSAALAFSP